MQQAKFETAVTILVGLGFPAKIQTVQEAYALLEDWPTSRRDTAHAVALKACRAALSGEIEAETARGLFVAFARKHDLLAPEPHGVVAARQKGNARRTAWRYVGSDSGDENERRFIFQAGSSETGVNQTTGREFAGIARMPAGPMARMGAWPVLPGGLSHLP